MTSSAEGQTEDRAPLVSVILPTYNRAHLVVRAIESALAQSYASVEIVVVDDGSTDGTRQKIESDFGDDARVRYLWKTNGGAASARNVGIEAARGEYVAFLDSDDTWAPWKLTAQIGCMERNREIGMTWTDMALVDAAGWITDPAHIRKFYSAYRRFTDQELFSGSTAIAKLVPSVAPFVGDACFRTGTIFSQMVMGNLVHTSTVVLSRERLSHVGRFDESLHYAGEDYEFHLRTTREGPVGMLDLPAIGYRQGAPDQLTGARYRIFMAENMLRTLTRTVAESPDIIRLPESAIRQKFAEVHAWVAFERLERGEVALARLHYLTSLRYCGFQPRLAKPILLATLPFRAGVKLRTLWRRLDARRRARRCDAADVT